MSREVQGALQGVLDDAAALEIALHQRVLQLQGVRAVASTAVCGAAFVATGS